MAWRPAHSLEVLRNEVNETWPNRSKASDGMIGDQAHAASASDHNPNPAGVVCAFDITHDPANGPDIGVLFNLFRSDPHPDLKYLIANRRIASRRDGFTQRMYTGLDPHTNHLHVSVGVGPDGRSVQPYDDLLPSWLSGSHPKPQPPQRQEDDMTIGQCIDQRGHKWFFVVGDDLDCWASDNNSGFFPLVPRGADGKQGAVFTAGLDALAHPDGQVVVCGRGFDGKGYQIVFTPGGPKPPWVGLIDEHAHHIAPK